MMLLVVSSHVATGMRDERAAREENKLQGLASNCAKRRHRVWLPTAR